MIYEKIAKELGRFKKRVFYSGKIHKQLEQMQYELDNLPYEIYDEVRRGCADMQIPIIKSIDETLEKIINDRCSISRFGDGEFSCMNLSRIAYHDPCDELADRLGEVLSSDLPNLLVGLPPCFGSLDAYVSYSQKFWRKYMSKKRSATYSRLDMDRVYYNAFFNRCYVNFNKTDEHYEACCTYFEKLKEIWNGRDVVILESQEARLGMIGDLLDGAKSVSRIIFCPVRNAFNKYGQILSAFDDIDSDTLILIALGPTGTVLAYDLCKRGRQAIDIGAIGAEYEYFLEKATPLELKSMGRSSAPRQVSTLDDPEYRKQIVKTLV